MVADGPGIEFDFRALGDGRSAGVRYANNSNYRNDSLIRKESEWEVSRMDRAGVADGPGLQCV